MSNVIWGKLSKPPKEALKPILAGRLKGKTDINPQWRYEIMTEVFGLCGEGWRFEIERLWTEPGSEGQLFAFAKVALSYKTDGEWSCPVPGIGGSMLVQKEKAGLYCNDEGYKMAVTDAIGTAMKMIGVAADIYFGKWDGSKYKDDDNSKKMADQFMEEVIKPKPEEITQKAFDQFNELHKDNIAFGFDLDYDLFCEAVKKMSPTGKLPTREDSIPKIVSTVDPNDVLKELTTGE